MTTNRSVDRALSLLRLVATARRPVKFVELTAQTGIPKATLHGLLASLETARFLARSAEGYQIGIAAFEIGAATPVPSSLREAVAPWLDRLAASTQEACHFGMLSGGDVVYLDRRDAAAHGLRFTVSLGQRLPAYGTGLGKAMLAQLPDEEVRSLYPADLPPVTARTLRSRARLLRALQEVRRQGYAVEREESTPGVCCIGAGVTTAAGVFGISVTVPVQRAEMADLAAFAPLLQEAVTGVRDLARVSHWLAPDEPLAPPLQGSGRGPG